MSDDVRCWLCEDPYDGSGIYVDAEGAIQWLCGACEDKHADEMRGPDAR